MTIIRRAVRALGAAATVAGILIAVPIGLWVLGRPLLPSNLPAWDDVVDVLSRPDDGRLFLGLLVIIGAVSWAVLAISIVAEIASVLTRRPVFRVDLPGFRIGRTIAATLIAAVLGLGAGPAIAQPAAVATTAWIAPPPPRPLASSEPAPSGTLYVVAPRDTLWGIADRELGDPLRWREIYELNVGRPQPDGGVLTEASLLTVGWHLELPALSDPSQVRVSAGDTLSEIALERLGSVDQTAALFDANRGRPQPDGSALSDPDLIRPGWILSLPDQGVPAPHLPAPAPAPHDVPPPVALPPLDRQTAAPLRPLPTPQPSAPAATTPPADQERHDDQPADESALIPITIGTSSLVIAGMLGALAVRRRRQMRARPPYHRIPVPTDAAGRSEWVARRQAPAVIDVEFLDAALRSLSLADWTGIAVPPVRSISLTGENAVVRLAARASLPGPFLANGERDRWTIEAGAELPITSDEVSGYCPPFPLLVSVASDDEATLFLDLEQLGLAEITGPADRAQGLLRHIAAELANARWADDVEILVVGFDDEVLNLNPDRLRAMPDLEAGLAEVRSHLRAMRANVDRLPVNSVLEGRLRDIAADSWLPVVLISLHPPSADELDTVAALARDTADSERLGWAVALPGCGAGGVPLDIDADGVLHTPGVDDRTWRAASVSGETATGLAAILGPTLEPAEPTGPATEDAPWADGMREDGTLAEDLDDEAEEEGGDEDADTSVSAPRVVVPGPRSPDPEAVRLLHIVDHQDPDLDHDLEQWRDPGTPKVPLIAILGEPMVRAPGVVPSVRPSWFTEVLVYLSLHPAGVSMAKALTDLWPDGTKISTATVRHAFYGARRWAGRGLDGDPDRAFVSDMQTDNTYRLRGHLLDWDLFRRLRKRAEARRAALHPGAVADFQAALSLVRGPVLNGLRPDGYAWLNNHGQRHDLEIPGFLVDAAHDLVDLALADGDTTLARQAAEIARSIDIDVIFDLPLTDLMRIAHAENNPSEMERYAAVLLDARGFDVPEELPPESFEVLNDLLPRGPRRARARA